MSIGYCLLGHNIQFKSKELSVVAVSHRKNAAGLQTTYHDSQ